MPERSTKPVMRDGVLVFPGKDAGQEDGFTPEGFVETLEQLAAAYLKGTHRVLMPEAAEDQCTSIAVSALHELLLSRDLPVMEARTTSAETLAQLTGQQQNEDGSVSARRRLFLPEPSEGEDAARPNAKLAELQMFKAGEERVLFAVAPQIKPENCTGCDACFNVCPNDVLIQINDENGQACYSVNPVSCDACGLCEDVCSSNAIELGIMAECPVDIPLTTWECKACRAPVHAPAACVPEDGLCHTCHTTGHHKKLFQVLS